MLLVLDNFEHIVGAAPAFAKLLQAAPELRSLATSRERLRLSAEHVYEVPPLMLPDATQEDLGTLLEPTRSRSSWLVPKRQRRTSS